MLTRFVTNAPCGRSMSLRLQVISRIECLAEPKAELRADVDARPAEKSADGHPHPRRRRRALIGEGHELRLAVIVDARGNDNARENFERLGHAFAHQVHARVKFVARPELPVLIEMETARFEQAVEVPVPVVAGVRPQLVEFPEPVLRNPDVPVDRRLDLAETAIAREKADFGIEVVPDLRVARAQPPRFRVVGGAKLIRVLVAVEPGRLRARDERVDEPVLPESQTAVDRIASVVILFARQIAGRLAIDEYRADSGPVRQLPLHARHAEVVGRQSACFLRLHAEDSDAGVAGEPP